MPSVTLDGQSLFVKARRAWLVGGGFEYSLCEPEAWGDRLDQLRRAGANTVVTSAPWCVHEPRPGRFCFEGRADLQRFIELCGERQFWVILRIGPSVGEPFDGGGIPAWVAESGPARLRESDPGFLERVAAVYREVLGRVSDLQATQALSKGRRQVGPVVGIEIEHRWFCANDEQADRYLTELVRYARECGAKVPLLTTSGAWQPIEGAVECWEGHSELLANLRQLRTLQDQHPRLAFVRDPAAVSVWGGDSKSESNALAALPRHLAATLAAGAMPLLGDAVGGVHVDRTAGRRSDSGSGGAVGFLATMEPRGSLIDVFGRLRPESAAVRRLLNFASAFGHVFADAEPDRQPVAVDPDPARDTSSRKGTRPASVVAVRGPGGTVVFAFAPNPDDRRMQLVLEDGRVLPVDLGSDEVGWFVQDVALRGQGNLAYSPLSVFSILRRKMLVLFGPAGSEGSLSISGSPLDVKVPGEGRPPLVAEHRGLTVVVLNEAQSLAAVPDGPLLRVGVESIDRDGAAIPAAGFREHWSIALDGTVERTAITKKRTRRSPVRMGTWRMLDDPTLRDGSSHRFASIDGPCSLRQCGVAAGYGWYRISWKQAKAAKTRLDLPFAGDRMRVHLDGELLGVFGEGPGAAALPIEVRIAAGPHRLVVLAEHLGRGADGLAGEARTGLLGGVVEVAPIAGVKVTHGEVPPIDPFRLRGFLPGLIRGTPPPEEGVRIHWTWRRKPPLHLELGRWPLPSMVFLNGAALARVEGDASTRTVLRLPSEGAASVKPGGNEVLVVPDEDRPLAQVGDLKALLKGIRIDEVRRELGGEQGWGFARWATAEEVCEQLGWTDAVRGGGGGPAWFRTELTVSANASASDLSIDLGSMSKGEVFLDGQPLGRYFAKADGKPVGPASLPLPASRLRPGSTQTLAIFDEQGNPPSSIRIGLA